MIKNLCYNSSNHLCLEEADFVADMWGDKLLASYDTATSEDIRHRQEYKFIEPIIKELSFQDPILDGGCGCGEWTVSLAQQGYNITGMDISARLIDFLCKSFPKNNFKKGDIRQTDFPKESLSLYFSWGAFEHFEIGLAPCLTEAHRILKPGGSLVFSVPFSNRRLQHKHEASLIKKYLSSTNNQRKNEREDVRFYQWRFTVGELARDTSIAGFDVEIVEPIDKDEGLRRMLNHDFGLSLKPASVVESLLLKILRPIVPLNYVAHMLLVVARKAK